MANVRALSRDNLTDPDNENRVGGSVGAGIFFGTGVPEGTVTAPPGSIFFRTDGTVTGVSGVYRKPFGSGTNATGWVSDQQSNAILTPDGGVAVWFTNKTGAAAVKGSVVTLGSAPGSVVLAPAGIPNAVGVIFESGAADGQPVQVVVSGVGWVLFTNGQSPTIGWWVGSSATVNGRADTQASIPDNSGAGLDLHFREIGHCMDTVAPGTDVLARVLLHFN